MKLVYDATGDFLPDKLLGRLLFFGLGDVIKEVPLTNSD